MKSDFKRFALVSLVCFFTASAFATQPGNNGGGNGGCGQGQQTNGCGGTSTGDNTATGGSATANAGAVGVGIGIGVGMGGAGGDASATGGAGGAGGHGGTGGNASASAAGGNGSGNVTKVAVGGTLVERSAPAVVVGQQTAPVVDCRRTIGGGASSPGGSGVVSGFPLWKESDCESVMGVRMMSDAPAGVFTIEDIRMVACRMEVVSMTPSCKAMAAKQ